MVATKGDSGGSGEEREGFSEQITPGIRRGANRKNCRSHCMTAKSDCEENSVLPFSMH